MGYWKTHTGLESPPRDPTYDGLPIVLGILPEDGFPEELVDTEAAAAAVLEDDFLLVFAMKAQLLAAKLNVLKYPGFANAQFADGSSVAEVISSADQILDGFARRAPVQNLDMETIKDLLDEANNNSSNQTLFEAVPGCQMPAATAAATPAPTAAGAVTGPSGLPRTGDSPDSAASWPWAGGIAMALILLAGLGLTAAWKRER